MSNKWKVSNSREFNYILDYAHQKEDMRHLTRILDRSDIKSVTEDISEWVQEGNRRGRGQKRSDAINLMFRDMHKDLIEIKHFGWIDKDNSQMCLFIIHQIINDIDKKLAQIDQRGRGRGRGRGREKAKENRLSHLLQIMHTQGSNTSLMYLGIILFIDYHDFHNAKEMNNQKSRTDYLFDLKKKWSETQKELSSIKWLNQKNEEQANWAINYIEKNTDLYIPELNPVSSEEKTISAIGAIQIADLHPAEKREILARMRSSWRSKENRSNGKKNINYRIDPDVFEQFEKLCKKKSLKKNIMLEELISQEYERTFGKRR